MRKPLSRPGQEETGTSQTSIRHHPPRRGAMREYAAAPIHTGGVALRHVGPPGCSLSPALGLDVEPPVACRYEPWELTSPNRPERSPRPACQAFFRRNPPSLLAEGVAAKERLPPSGDPYDLVPPDAACLVNPPCGYSARASFSCQVVPASAAPTSRAPGSAPWPPPRPSCAAGRRAGPARRTPGPSASAACHAASATSRRTTA